VNAPGSGWTGFMIEVSYGDPLGTDFWEETRYLDDILYYLLL
jgi:hypothetical protein